MMAGTGSWLLMLAAVAPLVRLSSGHGRLMEPPSRSSMWRQGFPSPINYADNQLFCGGFKHQWEDQGGRCGVCGDPYDGPRAHEPGGKYYTGITTRTFTRGQVVDVEVELTAFHYGYFEFRLCPLAYRNQTVGQGCFDQHLLRLVTPSDSGLPTRYKLPPDPSTRMVKVKVALPPGVTCDQCVLQWKYHAANSWGSDFVTGRGCVGCGPQEEFYGCSDVTILTPGGTKRTVGGATYAGATIATRQGHKSAAKTEVSDSVINQTIKEMLSGVVKEGKRQQDDWAGSWNVGHTASGHEPRAVLQGKELFIEPRSLDSLKEIRASLVGKCHSTGAWKGQAAIDDWCELNCERGHCPPSHCLCNQEDALAGGRKSAAVEAWTPFTHQTGMQYSPQTPTAHKRAWASQRSIPEERSAANQNHQQTRQSYLRSRPQLRGGVGFMGGARRASNNRVNWREPLGSSKRGLRYNHPPSNSIPTEADMERIMAYSRETFNSIKDEADAAYRSLIEKQSPMAPGSFLENYKPNRGPRKPTNTLHDPSSRRYVKRIGQNPYPWVPQAKSNSLVYNNFVYPGFHSQAPPREHFHWRDANPHRNSNHNIFNDRKSSERDLIAKAQFVDASQSATVGRHMNPQPKQTPRPRMRQGGRRGSNCIASGAWTGQASMTKWCQGNCALGNCPPTHCRCT